MMSDLALTADRPWRFLILTLVLAAVAVAATAAWLRTAPRPALVGLRGQHDSGPAAAACLDCHVPFVGTPATRCLSPGCHGALATGTPPRSGPAMPERFHAALRDIACVKCHVEHGRDPRPATEAGAESPRFDHRAIPNAHRRRCRRCHGAADRPTHARSDAVGCGTCHGWNAWTGTPMDHQRVAAEACELCHVAPRMTAHVGTAGACDDCHQTTHWKAQDAAK